MRLQEALSNRTPACTDRQTAEPPPSPTPNGVEPTCRQTKPLAGPHTPDTLPKGAYDVIIVGAGQPSAVGGCCRYRRRRCLLPAVPAAAHPPRMPSLPRLLAALIPRPLRLRGGLLPGQGRRPCGPAGQGAMTMGSCHYRRVPGHAGSSGLHHTGRACVCNRQQLSICHLLPLVALFTTRMGPAGAKQAHPAVCPVPACRRSTSLATRSAAMRCAPPPSTSWRRVPPRGEDCAGRSCWQGRMRPPCWWLRQPKHLGSMSPLLPERARSAAAWHLLNKRRLPCNCSAGDGRD